MTGEEMERAIEFLLQNQARHEAQIIELRETIAETNRVVRLQAETQTEFIQIVTKALSDLADAQKKTNAQVDRTQTQLGKTQEQLGETNAQIGETNARLDRLAGTVEKLIERRSDEIGPGGA